MSGTPRAARDKLQPDWLRLAFSAAESDLGDPQRRQSWLAFVRETVEDLDPAFGIIDYLYDSFYGQTAVEHTIKPLYMWPWYQGIPTSRQVLRGYDWLTICPQELADRLEGAEVLPLLIEERASRGEDYRIVYQDASVVRPTSE